MKSVLKKINHLLSDIPASDFDGVDDPVEPKMICLTTMGEALEERVRFYVEQDPELARDIAYAALDDVDWKSVADKTVDRWIDEEEQDATCPSCRRGEMCLTGAKLHYVCDLCGHTKKIEREEP